MEIRACRKLFLGNRNIQDQSISICFLEQACSSAPIARGLLLGTLGREAEPGQPAGDIKSESRLLCAIPLHRAAIIVYRLPWTWKCSKLLMKCIHAGLHLTAAVLVIIALVAVFDFHNAKKIPNMYSLHSWVGLVVVILFMLQIVVSIVVFLIPTTPVSVRAALMPIHVYGGLLLFGGVIGTSLMGITEKLIFSLKNPPYSSLPPHAIFVNTLGILIVVFGGLIIWIATRPGWKRPPEPVVKEHSSYREASGPPPEYSKADKSDVELNSEAARKRNLNLDEAGQRSTM